MNGKCLSIPSGILRYDSNFITCDEGFIEKGGHCYKNTRYLNRSSSINTIRYISSSGALNQGAMWRPNSI